MSNPAQGRILPFTRHAGTPTRRAGVPDATDGRLELLQRKAGLCSGMLIEAGRLVAMGMFATALSRLLGRAGDMLDELDEMLIALDPARDHQAFTQAAELHRRLETIQSQLPREFRRAQRGTR